ncbi:putative ubiquitin-protein ligase e3 c [Phaeomoniella chlamydospora]|uniref:Protein arginine methyltransferase NDUFAF7 n=1 Tax=Phaeomoniella chlamydospora TaxID=158046 RepID=A0A0G2EHJ3_PHACM|nr:putative ubiquitin-protein ligase e3 c [Phaeomoniella chlamydospora]
MLTRDFIEDSLYNPSYGYFSKHATIFNPGDPFDFNSIQSDKDFHELLGQRYMDFEDKIDDENPDDNRQLWHTPTELFRPYYGEAIARYLVANYKLTVFPYDDLIIYEMGAGNGTMMRNIMDYIRDFEPEVYQRTKYRIIEISSSLAGLQELTKKLGGHAGHVEILNRSVFDWNEYVSAPCFFLALEVFDNFAHDEIRYNPYTEGPLQGGVLIDNDGEFFEYYEQPEFIPTRLMQFFDVLQKYFPAHKLVASDFNKLPSPIKGINAPIVQTRYQRKNVTVTTPFVHQGYFDIFFPSDFTVMEDIYRAITGKLTKVSTHRDFLERWAWIEETTTANGENPMLEWYKNAMVLTTI